MAILEVSECVGIQDSVHIASIVLERGYEDQIALTLYILV
jgi:hypothetical protein